MHEVGNVFLRRPEPRDVEALWAQKNDPEVADLLGGFTTGYSRAEINEWVDRHRGRADESIWVIASESDACLGHVGLYQLDHRIRSGEFAIMLGDKSVWGKGIGKQVTQWAVDYGFSMLNLNRVDLSVLATNRRALALYEGIGFVREGVRRQGQFKHGEYIDVVLMSILRSEWEASRSG